MLTKVNKVNHTKSSSINKKQFFYRISDIISRCNSLDNMMVSIYLIKHDRFIYCNESFNKIVGYSCDKLFKSGWDFWFSLIDEKESLLVKNKVLSFLSTPHIQELFVLPYHVFNVFNERICLRHEILIYKLEKQFLAINFFQDITTKEKIERHFKGSQNCLSSNLSTDQIPKISSREKEVLNLIADGFSSKQIADKLFISNHTAISHRKNLIEKFRVKNTAQLIKRASRLIELW